MKENIFICKACKSDFRKVGIKVYVPCNITTEYLLMFEKGKFVGDYVQEDKTRRGTAPMEPICAKCLKEVSIDVLHELAPDWWEDSNDDLIN